MELVINNNGQAVTNSLLVAEKFGKEHRHVLEAIRNMTAENSALLSMFWETTYLTSQNKKLPMFIMNRDGFTLLVMGFTGKNAMRFKVEYIEAFNKMEATIKEKSKPLSQLEYLQYSLDVMKEQAQRLSNVEGKIDRLVSQQQENENELKALPLSSESAPEMSLRDKVRLIVNRYCNFTGLTQYAVWDTIYQSLYYNYHISLKSCAKKKNESWLDVADRKGHLDKIYAVASDLLRAKGLTAST